MRDFVSTSLELHLFFARIMKEHALFLEVGFTKAGARYSMEAKRYKEAFEELLARVVACSDGAVDYSIFESGEVITEYTAISETKTCQLTGSTINQKITLQENKLWHCCNNIYRGKNRNLEEQVHRINQRCLTLLDGLIEFKQRVLDDVLHCELFTVNYPLLIEHIIREAKLYRKYIKNLECDGVLTHESMRETELFWNQIMMEHALFIRGLLDPEESELIQTANDFAYEYCNLIEEARTMTDKTICSLTNEIIDQTIRYRDFKKAGAKGINECNIRSLILPLLADHVLREANHYLRILSQ